MRKIGYVALICCVLVCLFACSAFAQSAQGRVAPLSVNNVCGMVIKCDAPSGRVVARISPSGDWVEAAAGMVINENDVIKTEGAARATMVFPGGITVSVKSGTELSVGRLDWGDGSKVVAINLISGGIKTIIDKTDPEASFVVETEMAVCKAAGTLFYVDQTDIGTGVYVVDGSVEVTDKIVGTAVSVVAGLKVTVSIDGEIDGPDKAEVEDIADWTAGYVGL